MKFSLGHHFVVIILSLTAYTATAQTFWKLQSLPIQTRWATTVNPDHVLPEYPRPQFVRKENWTNLNGLWNYAITDKDAAMPTRMDSVILVPYPIESALSGVKKALLPTQNLWYKRRFNASLSKVHRILLNFGAIDWQATIYVNGKEIGQHTGGYTAFSFDITDAAKEGDNELVIKVYDPTDQGIGPHGKQVLNPENIYYTASSGIWQTVWMETVPSQHISTLSFTPNIDNGTLQLTVNAPDGYQVEAVASLQGKEMGRIMGAARSSLALPVKNFERWSPSKPVLYDLAVKLLYKGKVVDEVQSYFGMRKVSIAKDSNGVDRIFLNNQPYFNLGTLDQGFWPDGLYTPPTDEAIAFDISAIKAMGFNTIRKHIKVEPARWYYYADKIGMLVWQDFVNPNQGLPEGSKPAFEQGCKEELSQLRNYPSITTWVLFNEKWGQYDQERLTKWIKSNDPSRIVNGHTGELLYVNEQLRSPSPNAYVNADMTDVHSYPDPMMPIKQAGKAQVVGEFGGIGVFIPDHQWLSGSAWGYIQEKPGSLQAKYTIMNQHLKLLEQKSLSGSIYTQPFDVEGEQNGLITYDRKVIKIPLDSLRKIHSLLNPDQGTIPTISIENADLTEPAVIYSRLFQQYPEGNRDVAFLKKLAMLALQTGDKTGASLIGSDYINLISKHFNEEDVPVVLQFTKSTKDVGFSLIANHMEQFKATTGDRKFTVALMNMVFNGEIEPVISANDKPDWSMLAEKVKPYGAAGEEILLRAHTIALYNSQDWANYVPVATTYLSKYGSNIPENERNTFKQAIDANQSR